jgi:hypothetical protein
MEEIVRYLFLFWQRKFIALVVKNEYFLFPNLINFAGNNLADTVFILLVKFFFFEFDNL